MRLIYPILCFLIIVNQPVNAQSGNNSHQNFSVESTSEAHFPQGEDSLFRYLYEHLIYTEEEKKLEMEGRVLLSFYVESNGSLSNIRILKNVCKECASELLKLLKNVKYTPATANGYPIRTNVMLEVPVRAH